MAIIGIPLKEIIIDNGQKIDLLLLSKEEAIDRIKKAYGFLQSLVDVSIDGNIAVIKLSDENALKGNEALAAYQHAVRAAQKGEYQKAIKLFQKTIDIIPQHIDARRNLAMAYLESGNIERAKKHLNECLCLDPKNSCSYLLLGNIYAKHEHNLTMAEFYYQRCFEINSIDNLLLNNYAALMMEKGNFAKAKELFEKALSIDSSYPNTYYGLAYLHKTMNNLELALQTLDNLFLQPKSKDVRSAPVYQQAQSLYFVLNKEIAEKSFEKNMELVLDIKREIEAQSGFSVQIVEDNSLQYVSAVAQMAWKHNRDEHIIKYRKKMTATTPHLIAHELEHIALEDAARKAGCNRHFATTAATREYSIKAISSHIYKLKEWDYSENKISDVMLQMIHGICNHLFNCPIDMMVEYRLFKNYMALHPSQFISLYQMQNEALQALQNNEIKNYPPKYTELILL